MNYINQTSPAGIVQLSIEDYHAHEALSRSDLMPIFKSPWHFKKALEAKHSQDTYEAPSKSMIIGSLVHTMCLEPHLLDAQYVVRPDFDRRTNAGKAGYNAFISTLHGRKEVRQEEMDIARLMSDNVLSSEYFCPLMDGALIEQSIFFNAGKGEKLLPFKVRPDAWNSGIVIDLKTTSSCEFNKFQRSCFDYGYFLQAGMIALAIDAYHKAGKCAQLEKFIIEAVENTYPYAVATFIMDKEAIDWGISAFYQAVNALLKSYETQEYPAYPLRTLTKPSWATLWEDYL